MRRLQPETLQIWQHVFVYSEINYDFQLKATNFHYSELNLQTTIHEITGQAK